MSAAPIIQNERKHPSFQKYVPYHLNWKIFGDDECKFGPKARDGKANLQSMIFSDLINLLMKKEIGEVSNFINTTVILNGVEHVIECKGLSETLLPVMLELISKKCSLNCNWFYYDSDRVKDDFHESFTFFLVDQKKIVLEQASVSHSATSWLNSDFLIYDNEHIWDGHAELEKASSMWWYQKFYSDTEVGQIMKIRDTMTVTDGAAVNEKSTEVLLFQQLIAQSKRTNSLLIWILIAFIIIFIFNR